MPATVPTTTELDHAAVGLSLETVKASALLFQAYFSPVVTRERRAMDSANCIGILMKAVQELSTKVKNLTSELETLTSKVEGGK